MATSTSAVSGRSRIDASCAAKPKLRQRVTRAAAAIGTIADSPPKRISPGASHGANGKPSGFTAFAQKTSYLAGKPVTFMLAAATIVVWAVTGPMFGYSDTWQLVINTGTTIVTFLMVFLIQNSQNRDALAFQIKLDELILAVENAENCMAAAEDLSDDDLEALHEAYRKHASETLETLEKRRASR